MAALAPSLSRGGLGWGWDWKVLGIWLSNPIPILTFPLKGKEIPDLPPSATRGLVGAFEALTEQATGFAGGI